MSKRRTVTMKALANENVTDIIDEQYGNLTQKHFQRDGAYKQVSKMLTEVARQAIQCALVKPASRPHFMKNWHKDFANDCANAMTNAGFETKVPRFVQDFKKRFPKIIGDRAEVEWSYYKIASYAGQCATMILYGLNPDLLKIHEDEFNEEMERLIDLAEQKGIQPLIVDPKLFLN